MRNKLTNSLLEILMCIIIFTLCAYISVLLMVKATGKSKQATLLSDCIMACENVAETIKKGDHVLSYESDEYAIVIFEDEDVHYIKAIGLEGELIYELEVRTINE